MGSMSCYTCKYSRIEASTGYLICKFFHFKKYVQPCNVCKHFELKCHIEKMEGYIDEEKEIEVEIRVIENEK